MAQALLDTNVLVYAAYRQALLHDAAARLVERGLDKRGSYCIAPQNLIEFAAVGTRRRASSNGLRPADIERICDLLYRSRTLSKIYPQRGTVRRAVREGIALGIYGSAWYDLFLAMTMRDNGVHVIVTENVTDFRRFPFLRVLTIHEAVEEMTV
jgi:predicted nucleic acid-binding protein